jgi:hypothetical protein
MDAQLRDTQLAKSFVKGRDVTTDVPEPHLSEPGEEGSDSEADLHSEVNDAVNFLSSAMESVASQLGSAGPLTNILGDLNVSIPPEWRLSHQGPGVDGGSEE